jgi:uncharacterized lipoprotein
MFARLARDMDRLGVEITGRQTSRNQPGFHISYRDAEVDLANNPGHTSKEEISKRKTDVIQP